MADAAGAASIYPAYLADLDWPSGHVRMWSGYGEIVYDSNTFSGTGFLGQVSEIRESADGAANGVTLTLSGIPSADIALALDNAAQGRSGKVYFALMTSAGAFAYGPHLVFDGIIDTAPIDDDGQSATISVQLEKEFINRRSNTRRRTHQDQQIDYPGDLFFDLVAGTAERAINWGVPIAAVAATSAPPSRSSGGNGRFN
jgi:hypothetical protein